MVEVLVHANAVALIHHQLIFLLCSVPLCPVLRIAVLHHHNTPSTCWCDVVGDPWRLLAQHYRSSPIGWNGGVPHAQVAAAAMNAAMHTPLLRATVMIADAFGGRPAKLVELLKVLSQGSFSQVTRGRLAESAQLIVRRLHTRMEESRVKVLSEVRRKRKNQIGYTHCMYILCQC